MHQPSSQAPFSGNKKVGQSILHEPEQKFIAWAVPKIPKWIHSVHLTIATVPISLLIVLFGFLAVEDIRWLWGASAMIALQWLTDSLDGAVGRARNTGLIRWGYYMDHLLDYFFYATIMISYMTLLPDSSKWLFFIFFALVTGFMMNSYLSMAATNEFRIAFFGIGPTEIRIAFIVINTLLIIGGVSNLVSALPFVTIISGIGLIAILYLQHKKLWAMDIKMKK